MHKFTIKKTSLALLLAVLVGCTAQTKKQEGQETQQADNHPNVIVIYIDDLGWGDLSSYGATEVDTPNVDKLANQGIRFTDAHSSASTCTPSRFSLLTGEHGFRSNAAILKGDAPALILPGKPTIASMFKKAGYKTGVVGKWHLGLGAGNVNWNEEVKPGPLEIGFDYSFLLPSTGDRVPSVYLENHHVVNLDKNDPITVDYNKKIGDRETGEENPELLRMIADPQHNKTIVNGVSRIGYMAGGESALWVDEEFPDVMTGKVVGFIRENKDNPFFLFYSHHDIHVPRLPHPRFQDTTEMGPRGDAIVQMDWMVGAVIDELVSLGIDDNTLIIFTSDNGPVLDDGYADDAIEKLGSHRPAGPYRGGKYSLYEGATRVPTIAYWPEEIEPKVSGALVSQLDLYTSMASLVGVEVNMGEAMDSLNMLPVWLGKSDQGRAELLEESLGVNALRQGQWKFIPGTKTKQPWISNVKGIEGGFQEQPQLFNLSKDPSEQHNLATKFPDRVAAMQIRILEIEQSSYK